MQLQHLWRGIATPIISSATDVVVAHASLAKAFYFVDLHSCHIGIRRCLASATVFQTTMMIMTRVAVFVVSAVQK